MVGSGESREILAGPRLTQLFLVNIFEASFKLEWRLNAIDTLLDPQVPIPIHFFSPQRRRMMNTDKRFSMSHGLSPFYGKVISCVTFENLHSESRYSGGTFETKAVDLWKSTLLKM